MAGCGLSAIIGGAFGFLKGALIFSVTYMNTFWDQVRDGAGIDDDAPILKC